MKLNERWSQLSKKSKMAVGLVGLVCVVAIVGGGSAYANNQSQQKMAVETQQTLDTTTTKLSDLTTMVEALLDSKDQNYLAQDVTEKQVNELKKEVGLTIQSVSKDTLSGNKALDKVDFSDYEQAKTEINTQLDKVQKALETQTTINSLYKQDKENVAMNGSKVKKDLPIKDDLKKETVEKAKKELFEKDTKVPYNKTINDLVTTAENQVNQIEKAKSEVAKVFKDGKVVSTDKKLYETAKTETDKIKNEKAKKSLSDQLAKVKSDLDKKEKEESEKAKTAEATKQEESKNADSVAKADTGQSNDSTATNTQQATADNGSTAGNDYTPSYDGGNQGGYAGDGSTGGGNQGGSTGGGSTGGSNQGGSTGGGSTGGGSQVPDGWIVPPYPIGSPELAGWLADQGYSGYDSAGGYIRPY